MNRGGDYKRSRRIAWHTRVSGLVSMGAVLLASCGGQMSPGQLAEDGQAGPGSAGASSNDDPTWASGGGASIIVMDASPSLPDDAPGPIGFDVRVSDPGAPVRDTGRDISSVEPCSLDVNIGPNVQGFFVGTNAPSPTGGPLNDGTYVLSALDYYAGAGFTDGGAKIQNNALGSETMIIQGTRLTLVGASGTVDRGLGPSAQHTYVLSISMSCDACADAGPRQLTLSGICPTNEIKKFFYTSLVDDAGHERLMLFVLWPDGGPSSEVRTYERQ